MNNIFERFKIKFDKLPNVDILNSSITGVFHVVDFMFDKINEIDLILEIHVYDNKEVIIDYKFAFIDTNAIGFDELSILIINIGNIIKEVNHCV